MSDRSLRSYANHDRPSLSRRLPTLSERYVAFSVTVVTCERDVSAADFCLKSEKYAVTIEIYWEFLLMPYLLAALFSQIKCESDGIQVCV